MTVTDQSQVSLTESALYELLINAITDYAIFMLDPSGLVTTWNPGAEQFKGYAAAEVLNRHFSIFYSEEDRRGGLPERALKTAAETGSFESEGWRVRKDRRRFWAYVVIHPILTGTGELIGFAKITRDLTKRKLAEDAARRNESQFRLLVQSVTDYAIFQLDPTGQIITWNSGAERIKGYLPDEIVSRNFEIFYTAADQAEGTPQRALETAARDGRFEGEGWRVRKTGDIFWAHVIIDAIRDASGMLIGFAKITRDLTEAKKAEFAIEGARDALLQSQKLEAIGQLTGGVAHDFNNLLTVILGGLEIIQGRLPEDPNITPLLVNAIQAAQRGRSLTQRMLAFARRQDLRPEAIDLNQLINGMTELLQRTLGRSVTVKTTLPPDFPKVLADPNQLELAILNLAINARDAMPDGGFITIAANHAPISNRGVSKNGTEYVCLSVIDLGDGMDEETLLRATQPFFTTKEIGKGTGLGLSMVHGFAEQSNGHFFLRSKLGEGTVAELWLPLAVNEATKTTMPQSTDGCRGSPSEVDRGSQPVVLAVDDDRLALMNTAATLNELGYRVYTATSGKQAIAIIRKERVPDLVVIDHSMPDMNGLELAEVIQTEWPDVRIIFATPLADSKVQTVPKRALQAHLEAVIATTG